MIYRQTYQSPLGLIIMQSDGIYLTGLWFKDSRDDKKHPQNYSEKSLPIFDETTSWLDTYFTGVSPSFTPKYKIDNLTPFSQMVTAIMNEIPFGSTITYNDIAKKIAKMKGITRMSAQAVGGAVGRNPICLIIPCHRVMGSNGNLTGYGGGIKNKIKLLELEGNDISKYKLPKKVKNNE